MDPYDIASLPEPDDAPDVEPEPEPDAHDETSDASTAGIEP